jgi:hypothetical protein
MEHELWYVLYRVVVEMDKTPPHSGHWHQEIVGVWLWAVVHDRPVSWACHRKNWPFAPPFPLPSQPTMSRRLQSLPVQQVLDALETQLCEDQTTAWVKTLDGKPLLVSGHSKDRESRWGYAIRGFAKGYKLHAIWGEGALPVAWTIRPLNESEPKVGQELVQQLPGEGYLLADKSYDSNPLYATAAKCGYQLVAPRKRSRAGLGHRWHCAARLRAVELLQTPFGQALFAYRKHIEHCFGWSSSFFAGLQPLPSWVRGLHRVRLWVQAKLLIHAVYLHKNPLPPLPVSDPR